MPWTKDDGGFRERNETIGVDLTLSPHLYLHKIYRMEIKVGLMTCLTEYVMSRGLVETPVSSGASSAMTLLRTGNTEDRSRRSNRSLAGIADGRSLDTQDARRLGGKRPRNRMGVGVFHLGVAAPLATCIGEALDNP